MCVLVAEAGVNLYGMASAAVQWWCTCPPAASNDGDEALAEVPKHLGHLQDTDKQQTDDCSGGPFKSNQSCHWLRSLASGNVYHSCRDVPAALPATPSAVQASNAPASLLQGSIVTAVLLG